MSFQFSALTPDEQKYYLMVQDIMGPSWVVQDDQRLRLARVLMELHAAMKIKDEALGTLIIEAAASVAFMEGLTQNMSKPPNSTLLKRAIEKGTVALNTTPPKV